MNKLMKLKFFKFQKSYSINTLVNAINKFQYTESNQIGFDISSYDATSINARFIEKVMVLEVITNPYGASEEIELTRYNSFEFSIFIFEKHCFLKIYNCPRSLKKLIEQFSKCLSDNFSLNVIKPNIEEFYKYINNSQQVSRINVLKLNVTSIPLSEKSNAKMEILSNENAYYEFKDNTNYTKYSIEKIKLKIRFKNDFTIVNISSSGVYEFSEIFEDFIDSYILHTENCSIKSN